jgi:hypothetical protein
LNRDFLKLTSLSFSLRLSVLRHVMYTIVDRYDNERETWSKSMARVAEIAQNATAHWGNLLTPTVTSDAQLS